MTASSRDARLATWIAEEQALRSQLAAPGTLSLAEGRLYDVDERLYAVASTTCLILDMNTARQSDDARVR